MKSSIEDRYKYPRTYHLPFSPGCSSDDKIAPSTEAFRGQEVVVTEKLDGENTTLYRTCMHARSLDSRHHISRDWVKKLQGSVGWQIPEGWRICGENMYATHSIHYDSLDSYFYAFSIWNEHNMCLSWDETCEWSELLGLYTPPVLWSGVWDLDQIHMLADSIDTEKCEGFVVRTSGSFAYDAFSHHVLKWVRSQHVSTDTHWMHSAVRPNRLRTE